MGNISCSETFHCFETETGSWCAMSLLDEDASTPRMFALPSKKRQRKDRASADTPRDVRNASNQSTPVPVSLQATTETRSAVSRDKECASDHGDPPGSAPEPHTSVRLREGAADTAATDAAVEDAGAALQPAEATTFRSLGLSDWLAKVCKSLGMNQPTQVQTGCIPAILAGRSAIGTAHTGSGKTAAFALPILQLLAKDPFGVFGLVLTPTRCDDHSLCQVKHSSSSRANK